MNPRSQTITVKINGENFSFFVKGDENKIPLAEVLHGYTTEKKGFPLVFALALNQNFVPKHLYEEITLKEFDEIEIISPHPGG